MIMSIGKTGFINKGEEITESNIDSIMSEIDEFIKETNEGIYNRYNINCKIPIWLETSEALNQIDVKYEIDNTAEDVSNTARIIITIPNDKSFDIHLMVLKLTEMHYRYDATKTDERTAPTIDEFFIRDFVSDYRAKKYPLFIEDENYPGEYIINYDVLKEFMNMKDVKFTIHGTIRRGRSYMHGIFKPDQIYVHVRGTRLQATEKASDNNCKHAIEIDANNWNLFERVTVDISKNIDVEYSQY